MIMVIIFSLSFRREITEQEIANLNRIATAPGGSTQQLNTGKHLCVLLSNSKKFEKRNEITPFMMLLTNTG